MTSTGVTRRVARGATRSTRSSCGSPRSTRSTPSRRSGRSRSRWPSSGRSPGSPPSCSSARGSCGRCGGTPTERAVLRALGVAPRGLVASGLVARPRPRCSVSLAAVVRRDRGVAGHADRAGAGGRGRPGCPGRLVGARAGRRSCSPSCSSRSPRSPCGATWPAVTAGVRRPAGPRLACLSRPPATGHVAAGGTGLRFTLGLRRRRLVAVGR